MPGLMGGIVHERLATKCSQLHLVADCVNFAPYILDHNSAVKRPAVNNVSQLVTVVITSGGDIPWLGFPHVYSRSG